MTNKNTTEKLGLYLRGLRKSKKITLVELAEMIGLSQPYLSQLENGNRDNVKPDLLKKFAEVLDVDYLELMSRAGHLENNKILKSEESLRPITSQIVIDEFTKVVDSQDDKGFLKYNTTIDEAKDEDYNWELMAIEEAVDMSKYFVKRIKELQKEIKELKSMRRISKYLGIAKENLKLAEENEQLKQENARLKKQYESL